MINPGQIKNIIVLRLYSHLLIALDFGGEN